ncbi:MAG: alkaline phosphatase family protein [Verrucomicrobiales bacterium]|nr:alkaline phosphatase family protein [Verrucomicrobiales bacterium]
MQRLAVLNVVGLTARVIGASTPAIGVFRKAGRLARVRPAFPAVTCTAQSNYLTGRPPVHHGIVANGWYHRELAEVQFWKQSNHLVRGPKLWEVLRQAHPGFTCAKLFWWHNMYSTADYSITPRPMYPADGRKVFDIYTWPQNIRSAIKRDLGEFPFPAFWGPAAGVHSPAGKPPAASRWIAESAKWIECHHRPTLSLVYLPHLDYAFQRHGPPAGGGTAGRQTSQGAEVDNIKNRPLLEIDAIVGDLIRFFAKREVAVVLLSEYGITPVRGAVHLNRVFRERGWLTIKEELGRELLDCGACRAFAVVDHQIAHVYVNDPTILADVREVVAAQPGVAAVLDADGKIEHGLNHPRAGDLVAVAREDAWFSYYYWLDDARAPDFAATVDIHRKPGFDPVELFARPDWSPLRLKAHIARRLLQKKLGFRMLMDVIPLDAGLVRGSHGCQPADSLDWPVVITQQPEFDDGAVLDSTDIFGLLTRR